MELLRCSNSFLSALVARKKHTKHICKGNGYLDPNEDRRRRYRTCFACRDYERVTKSHARARNLAKRETSLDMCYPVREASADMNCVCVDFVGKKLYYIGADCLVFSQVLLIDN